MRFIIDYDILKKIKESKNGKSVLRYDRLFFVGTLLYTGGKIIKDVTNGESTYDAIADMTIPFAAVNMVGLCVSFIKKTISTPFVRISADNTLESLVNDLSRLEVNTSLELLKESKINTIEYELIYTDDSLLPRLKKNTYIDVPLNNEYEETILQEHIIGDIDYEVSVKSPIKNKKLKLARA